MMARFSPYPVLFLLACGAQPAEQRQATDAEGATDRTLAEKGFPLKGQHVVFYNVENLFDTEDDPDINDQDFTPTSDLQWTEDRLRTKLEHLAEAISLAGKDLPVLVGVCEVENKAVLERLANETGLKQANYAVVHFDSPDERGIDVGLLFDQDIFQLVQAEALRVPLKDDLTRDILHAELSAGADFFHVFVNHWPSRREGQEKSEPKRMAAARVLKNAIADVYPRKARHVLIMGDLNDTPLDRSVQDGLGAACTKAPTGLVDLMCVDQPQGHGSHQYNGEWDYLDQFIVSGELMTHVQEAKAVWNDQLLFKHPKYGPSPDKTYSGDRYKGGYSDHLPIVLRFAQE